ncbi:LacI family transcriptional regulator [Meridianimarinicoccus roseus]|jgi:LacI family transcriptional regulator|uniref:LacI family transcriptional regulator n=1 Tax=Meridianimarinicoccus roseus TaxID=2072018 RepID=A0A2V2LG22_9RHOB|nr:substrate-binding domain-containing protein [Meridianimarinicoccus roseus]PWR02454.1 LacI family transcriptional regulator [Meridianimarinicoccus roseus]
MDRRVTLRDLANELGLSKGTVSRALNGYRDISPATIRRVQEVSERIGYRPLALAQSIRTGQSRSLGLVLQMEQHDAQRPFLAEFLRGITRTVSAQNWTLTMATAESEEEGLETYLRLIDERKADGFILPRTQRHDPRIALLREAGCPFVLFGRTEDSADCAWFDIRGGRAMHRAVARLVDFGHRRIAFVGADPTYTYAAKRLDGYYEGMAEAGLSPIVTAGHATAMDGGNALCELLDGIIVPTGIICATDLLAIGAVRAAQARGLTVGRDVSIIGYDGSREGQYLDPPLTSFAVDQTAAGARLAELLIARVGGADPKELRETADAVLREGGTDGPPPKE